MLAEDAEKATESRHPYRGAVNCRAATALTESMLQQHTEFCASAWSQNYQRSARIWRNKKEHLLDKVSALQCGPPRSRSETA